MFPRLSHISTPWWNVSNKHHNVLPISISIPWSFLLNKYCSSCPLLLWYYYLLGNMISDVAFFLCGLRLRSRNTSFYCSLHIGSYAGTDTTFSFFLKDITQCGEDNLVLINNVRVSKNTLGRIVLHCMLLHTCFDQIEIAHLLHIINLSLFGIRRERNFSGN